MAVGEVAEVETDLVGRVAHARQQLEARAHLVVLNELLEVDVEIDDDLAALVAALLHRALPRLPLRLPEAPRELPLRRVHRHAR